MTKKHILITVLALALCVNVFAFAEGITTLPAPIISDSISEFAPGGEFVEDDGPIPDFSFEDGEDDLLREGLLELDQFTDEGALLRTEISITYTPPGTKLIFKLAAEPGEGEDGIGALKQFKPAATEEDATIQDVRYSAIPSADNTHITLKFSLVHVQGQVERDIEDTLVLARSGNTSLTVASWEGSTPIPIHE